jgi:Ca2+/Na+ antiporter
MLDDFIKIILLLLLLITIIVDIPIYNFLKSSQYQFLIALIILSILLFVDTGMGFILAIIMFIIYFKIYTKIINKNSEENMDNKNNSDKNDNDTVAKENIDDKNITDKNNILYISPQHLVAAQNNIFNIESYNTEVKGFQKGHNNENVYSAQGFDIEKNYVSGFDDKFYLNYNLDNFFSKIN